MKHSIRMQLTIIFSIVIIGTVGLCWILNSSFLGEYYINQKVASLKIAYSCINEASNKDEISSEAFDIEIQKICAKYNLSMLVMDEATQTVKSTMSDTKMLWSQLLNHIFFQEKKDNSVDTSKDEENNGIKILEAQEQYMIQIGVDYKTNTDYIEMWGELDNDNMFIIRSPLDSIQDSVVISNQFLAYIGMLGILFSIIISMIVANKITVPIKQLMIISNKMKHLDFNAKYEGEGNNEVALLGKNINELSSILEQTISELKSANNELQKDLEKKNQAEEMRKEFLSNVSHELKTPIALIQGYAEGLKEGIIDNAEDRDFYCDVIIDETTKMNRLVKNLLTLNQLEFGNDKITLERFDIATLIRNYLHSIEIILKQNQANVRFDCDMEIYVWGDEFKIEEVIMNYLSNALNHLDGDKIIDIRIQEAEDKVKISVFNTGNPIPKEEIPRIWEKFYKVDKARTREYGGSGVGLSIVKAIMESLHQRYGVDNYENGVVFWFELDKA